VLVGIIIIIIIILKRSKMQRRLQSYALYANVGGSYVFSLSVCVSVCLQDITKCCQRILIRIQEFFKGILSLRDKGIFFTNFAGNSKKLSRNSHDIFDGWDNLLATNFRFWLGHGSRFGSRND